MAAVTLWCDRKSATESMYR